MESLSTTSAYSVTRSLIDEVNREYAADEAFRRLAQFSAFVPGVGSMDPRLILIGEAPGVQEDRQRVPFVGASGRVLNDLLADLRLLREDCYITNVLKFRPPDNRTPTTEEIDLARPYLRRELNAFTGDKPDLPPVVLLGRVSLQLIDPETPGISKVRGEIVVRGAWRFVPVYHPAAGLRNGALMARLREDFALVRRLMNSG